MRRFNKIACCLFLGLIVCNSAPVQGRIIYVSRSGDGTTGNTWETAYNTINAALVASVTNDEIRVSADTYGENIEVATPLTIVGGFELLGKGSDDAAATRMTTITAGGYYIVQLFADTTLMNMLVTGGSTGIRVKADSVILNCIIDNNTSEGSGAGIACSQASVTIQGCTISNNTARMAGGGVFCLEAEVTMKDSVIFGNRCLGDPGAPEYGVPRQEGLGGGVSVGYSEARISNCVFYDNDAELGADIYFSSGGTLRVENCTFGSTAYRNIYQGASPVGLGQVFNSIVWGHATPFRGDDWIVTHSNVRGGFEGAGNINEDPLFVNAAGGDFHVQANSPCIDSASINGPATDLDGNPRPLDVPGMGRDGTGDEFDMGAYEHIPEPTPIPTPTMVNPRSDIDGSSKVDSKDVLILMADWQKSATGTIE